MWLMLIDLCLLKRLEVVDVKENYFITNDLCSRTFKGFLQTVFFNHCGQLTYHNKIAKMCHFSPYGDFYVLRSSYRPTVAYTAFIITDHTVFNVYAYQHQNAMSVCIGVFLSEGKATKHYECLQIKKIIKNRETK